jgi:hypothetical protein
MTSHDLIHMSSSETHSKNEEDVNNEDAVVAQIGEDSGLSADTMEQDSKSMDNVEKKQRKGTNRSKTEE